MPDPQNECSWGQYTSPSQQPVPKAQVLWDCKLKAQKLAGKKKAKT